MNTNITITRDIDINFSIDQIKVSIERVIKLGVYTKQSHNDVFNTLRISKLDGLEMVFMNITLKKLEDNSTNIKVDVVERLRNAGHEIIVNRVIDNFLDRLGKSLTGVNDEEIKKASNSGCFNTIVFFAGIGSLITYLLS
jgi:hypothetical protein